MLKLFRGSQVLDSSNLKHLLVLAVLHRKHRRSFKFHSHQPAYYTHFYFTFLPFSDYVIFCLFFSLGSSFHPTPVLGLITRPMLQLISHCVPTTVGFQTFLYRFSVFYGLACINIIMNISLHRNMWINVWCNKISISLICAINFSLLWRISLFAMISANSVMS